MRKSQSAQLKKWAKGTSLAVQWLGLCSFIAEGPGSIPGRGTKIPQAARCGQKANKQKNPKWAKDLAKTIHRRQL